MTFFTKNTHRSNLKTVFQIIRMFLDTPTTKVLSSRGIFKFTFTSTEVFGPFQKFESPASPIYQISNQ